MRKSKSSLVFSLLELADSWAQSRSKGNTKVGAVVYHEASGSTFLGYNGFPSGMPDREDWWSNPVRDGLGICKHDLVIHAEANAVRKAIAGLGTTDLRGCFMVSTMRPCARCLAQEIGQSNIKVVHYLEESADSLTARDWMVAKTVVQALNIMLLRIQLP